MFNAGQRLRIIPVSFKLLYRNPRQPGEAGMKVVPDQSHSAAEKKILEERGFIVIEIACDPSFRRRAEIASYQ
jgi:hypothetical protein